MIEGTYKITNLGCKVNKAESIEIERQFLESGYRRATLEEIPEYWVVNTCAVTAAGMQKSRKAVRKCTKTGAKVIAAGCGVDFDRDEFESMGIAGVVSNLKKERIVSEICKLRQGESLNHQIFGMNSCRVPIKVQDGCAVNCSYCIVPKLRTRHWCAKKELVVEKVKLFKDAGAGEIILCGIDLGHYRDDAGDSDLAELVRNVVNAVPDIWIRLSSISVLDINRNLIELFKEYDSLCCHLHIPLQSGDDDVLRSMNRGYDRDCYLKKIGMIREMVPGISITTDVMVGFPTENEDGFMNTVDLVREVGFSKVHIFRYSPRPNTRAFTLKDPVSGEEKRRRSQILTEESRKSAETFHKNFIGRTLDVLVEEESNKMKGELVCRSRWYSEVRVKGGPELIGDKVDVLIDGIDGVVLSGVVAGA